MKYLTLAFLFFKFPIGFASNLYDVCSRTPDIVTLLQEKTSKDCSDINQTDLNKIAYLHLKTQAKNLQSNDFLNLENLHYLKIEAEKLRTLPADLLSTLKLQMFVLKGTKVKKIPESFFHSQKKIKRIELLYNPVKKYPDKMFAPLVELSSLTIYRTKNQKILEKPNKTWKRIKELRNVYIDKGPVSNAPQYSTNFSNTNTLLKSIVSPLTGHSEISPGVRIKDRGYQNIQYVRDYLINYLKPLNLKIEKHKYSKTGTNISAYLPATIKTKKTMIIGAHYDHPYGPGANDNATGVAIVLSLAKYLVTADSRNTNLIFVLFDEEEDGLAGSNAYARKILKEGLDVTSILTIDQAGWDNDGDRAIEIEAPSKDLQLFYRCVAANYHYEMDIHRTNIASTDHSSFRRFGYSAAGFTEEYVNGDTTPHYHRKSDTYETVNFDYLEHFTNFTIDSIYEAVTNTYCK